MRSGSNPATGHLQGIARAIETHFLWAWFLEHRSDVKMHLGKFEGVFWMASEERREKLVSD